MLAAVPSVQAVQNQPTARYWNSDWKFNDIDLADVSAKLAALGIDVPIAMRGRAAVDLQVGVPWTALRTGKAYRIAGTIRGTNINVDTLRFKKVNVDVRLRDGVLTIPSLSLEQDGGQVNGNLTAEIMPRGKFNGNFRATGFEVRPLAMLLSRFDLIPKDIQIRGAVGFDVQANGLVDNLSDVAKWNGSGTATIKSLQLARKQAASPAISGTVNDVSLKNGTMTIGEFNLRADRQSDLWIRGRGTLPLAADGAFAIDLLGNDIDYASFADIWWPGAKAIVDGKLDFVAKATGNLIGGEPKDYGLNARVASPNLSVMGLNLGLIEHQVQVDPAKASIVRLGDRPASYSAIDSVKLRYSVDDQRLLAESIEANVFGGNLAGAAQFARLPEGMHMAKLAWSGISPEMTTTLPLANRPTTITGVTSGSIDWTTKASDLMDPSTQRGLLKIEVQNIAAKDQPLGAMQAEIILGDESVSVTADGEILGGQLQVRTKAPLTDTATWKALSAKILVGILRLSRVSIGQTSALFGIRPPKFDGEVSLLLQLRGADSIAFTVGARNVTAFSRAIADRVVIRGVKTNDGFQIENLSANYAGGSISGDGMWRMAGSRLLRIRITRVDASLMLLPISKSSGDWLAGKVSGSVVLTSSASDAMGGIRISGNVAVQDGALFDAPIGDARSPIVVKLIPGTSTRWSVDFNNVHTAIAGGRAIGKLSLASAVAGRQGFDLDSEWRLTHVDFRKVLSESAGTRVVGHGDLTGFVTLNGQHVESEKDLDGRFRFQLGGTDAGAVPGILSAGSFIGPASLAGTRFEEGRMSGRVSQGIARIEECVLTARSLGFEADGTVNLTSGRLSIDAVLATGNFQGQTSILRQTFRPRVVDAIGVGAINQILSDRTVVFQMNGNVRSPVIRLMPGETIRANARSVAVRQLSGALTAGTILAP